MRIRPRLNLPTQLLQLAVVSALLMVSAVGAAAQSSRPGVERGLVDRGAERVPGRIVVKFDPSLSTTQVDDLLAREGLRPLRTLGRGGSRLVQGQSGRELEIIDRLLILPSVEYAEPDYVVRADMTPTDPLYGPYQADLPVMGMPAAWDVTLGTNSVIAAVLDTGLALNHPDLIGQWAYAPGHSASQHVFLSSPTASYPTATTPDDDGWQARTNPFTHGTHVSGTIAAQMNNEAGVAGIAPGARILPLKVLDCTGSGSFSDIATAITFAADNGASVINMSLGANLTSGCPTDTQDAINYAFGRGVMIVAGPGTTVAAVLAIRPVVPTS